MAKNVAYSDVGPLITEMCTEEDLRHNFEQLQNVLDLIGNPYIPKEQFDTAPADPNAVAIRFQLQTNFGGSPPVASAEVMNKDGTGTGVIITVRDMLGGTYGRAVGNEWGFAVPIKDGNLTLYDIRFLDIDDSGGGGGGGGTDELVARFSGNAAGYLNSQLVATVFDVAAYNASTHQPVYAAITGSNVRLYTNVTTADGKVAVTAVDYAAGKKDYLDTKLKNVGTTVFNASTHAKVYHDKTATGTNGLALESYILFADLPGTVRVSSGDSLAYLQDQFTPVVGTAPAGYEQCTIVSNGTVLQVWAPPPAYYIGGCGINIVGTTISVDVADLAGDGLGVNTTAGACQLKVNVGCGLEIESDTVKVDGAALAGLGLIQSGSECMLAVDCDWVRTNCGPTCDDIYGCMDPDYYDPPTPEYPYIQPNVDALCSDCTASFDNAELDCTLEIVGGKLKLTITLGTKSTSCELDIVTNC